MLYPKINSIWKRHSWYFDEDMKNNPDLLGQRNSFIVGDYARPEFGLFKKWLVQEKIDGTNIRVHYDLRNNRVSFSGRTEESNIPKELYDYLKSTFTMDKIAQFHSFVKEDIWLFGEGYGPKIQKDGEKYRKDIGFILFDANLDSEWLSQDEVKSCAEGFGIEYAPIIGHMTEEEIIEYVKSNPKSLCSIEPRTIEGVIARTDPLVLFSNGKPVMMKVKCRDFAQKKE